MSLMTRLMAAKVKPAPKPETKKPAPSFEARRAAWREEAIAKLARPEVGPVLPGGELELVTNLAQPELVGPPRAPGPLSACKAISADTGRQCCLYAGHASHHRHGRTDFIRVATPGQTSFARRDALDGVATARFGSTTTNHQET